MNNVFLAGLIMFEVLADIQVKRWSVGGSSWAGVSALAFYMAANTSWLVAMRFKSELALGANIFSVASGVVAAVIGLAFFGENLNSQQIAGVMLGFLSLILLVTG